MAICGLTLLAACSREEYAAPPPAAIEQVPGQVEAAFQGAPTEVSAEVQSVLTSVRGDDPSALNQLQELGQRPELTPAQRAAANQAMFSVLARVSREATNGNAKAAEALEQYRSSK